MIRAVARPSNGAPRWLTFEGRTTHLTYRARTAIALACHALGINRGDEILVPAYNCGTEVDPLMRSGATVIPYRVDSRARIDTGDLCRRISSRTRLVYVIHYFGWLQDLSEVSSWCRRQGLALLEDCALALLSHSSQGPAGAAGDLAVFNFPKWLPVPDGGALVTRCDGPTVRRPIVSPPRRRLLRDAMPLIKRGLLYSLDGIGVGALACRMMAGKADRREMNEGLDRRPDMPADYYFDESEAAWGISNLTTAVLRDIDAGQVVAMRRSNYLTLMNQLMGLTGVSLLYEELPNGVCPLLLPILVDQRDRWIRELGRRGIAAIPWWAGYHRALDWDRYPEACGLKNCVVALPIHQDMDAPRVQHVASCVREISVLLS